MNLLQAKMTKEQSSQQGVELGSPIVANLQSQLIAMFLDQLSKVKVSAKYKALMDLYGTWRTGLFPITPSAVSKFMIGIYV